VTALAPIVGYVPRACLPAKRRIVLALPCGAAVLFGLVSRVFDGEPAARFADVLSVGLFGLCLPLGALVIGDAVLGAEVRSAVFGFTWLSPVPWWQIVVGRWLGGWAIAVATIVPAFALGAIVAGAPSAIAPLVFATSAGLAAHIALFVLIGCTTRRAAVWSLAIVLLVERLLGAVLTGIAQLSPTWMARAVYADLGPLADDLHRSGIPEGAGAIVRLVLLTAAFLAVATWRIGKLQLTGARD
jgi:hypothetical protein